MALAKLSSIDKSAVRAPAPLDPRRDGGFSLLEVLVASTIMAVALTTLAQLFVMSTNANTSAKTTTYAAVLAQQKMEQLRGLAWGFDTLGLPVTDISTDISVVPAPVWRRADRSARTSAATAISSTRTAPRSAPVPRRRPAPSTSAAGRSSRCQRTRTTRSSCRCSSRGGATAAPPTRRSGPAGSRMKREWSASRHGRPPKCDANTVSRCSKCWSR